VTDYINPWRMWHGAFVPEWLCREKGASPGAKLTYGRLCRYAGKKGFATPTQDEIAEEVGVEIRQLQRYVAELKKIGLIEVEQRGLNQPNVYRFPAHPWMGFPDTSDVSGPDTSDRAAPDQHDVTGPKDTSDVSPPTSTRESQVESHLAPVGPAPVVKGRAADPIWDTLMEVCGVETASITPQARGAYNAAVKALKEVKARPDDIRARAQVYGNRFPGTMTPTALVRHWAECDPTVTPMQRVSRGQDAITRVLGS
jgi:hypothetical protein